ncbi:hypothetical protein ACFCYN_20055 [Gottfriedia sp. NPDC056225]|uniref:hypothetical protein n=1 Tax=Gottfriedia sp. NPDC056225 TaxID=3345751 RepID=UPI0035DE1A0A
MTEQQRSREKKENPESLSKRILTIVSIIATILSIIGTFNGAIKHAYKDGKSYILTSIQNSKPNTAESKNLNVKESINSYMYQYEKAYNLGITQANSDQVLKYYKDSIYRDRIEKEIYGLIDSQSHIKINILKIEPKDKDNITVYTYEVLSDTNGKIEKDFDIISYDLTKESGTYKIEKRINIDNVRNFISNYTLTYNRAFKDTTMFKELSNYLIINTKYYQVVDHDIDIQKPNSKNYITNEVNAISYNEIEQSIHVQYTHQLQTYPKSDSIFTLVILGNQLKIKENNPGNK